MNRGFSTDFETEPKNQYRPNTNIKVENDTMIGRNSILLYYDMVATASAVPVHDNSAFCLKIETSSTYRTSRRCTPVFIIYLLTVRIVIEVWLCMLRRITEYNTFVYYWVV